MNTDEERQRAVAAIDAQIVALIEDGVPADSSRIRALVAKRAVAQKSKKAIKRSVREARPDFHKLTLFCCLGFRFALVGRVLCWRL